MKKRDLLFAAVIVALIIFLYFLSATARKPPAMPADAVHAKLTDLRSCPACHGPGKVSPLKQDHPPKEHCFKCHKLK
ncbi:MAG: cytochrome c family protein [Nitrospirota bacterium]